MLCGFMGLIYVSSCVRNMSGTGGDVVVVVVVVVENYTKKYTSQKLHKRQLTDD